MLKCNTSTFIIKNSIFDILREITYTKLQAFSFLAGSRSLKPDLYAWLVKPGTYCIYSCRIFLARLSQR